MRKTLLGLLLAMISGVMLIVSWPALVPLLFKAPAGTAGVRQPGSSYPGQVAIGDIAPTIYRIMGWNPPPCVDGHPLP